MFSYREMPLWALRGYWLPTAYQHQNRQGDVIADDELRHMALDAIHRLSEGADFLHRDSFGGATY